MKPKLAALIISISLTTCREKNADCFSKDTENYLKVVSCTKAVKQAYTKSINFINGKEYCNMWCDSLTIISRENELQLEHIEPCGNNKDLIDAGIKLNSYFNKISQSELKTFIEMVFTDQEYTHEYEVELHRTEVIRRDQYNSEIKAFEIALLKANR